MEILNLSFGQMFAIQIISNFMWPLQHIQDPFLSINSNYVEGICKLMHPQEKLLPII